MKVLYFAWVRERVGKAEEDLTLPEDLKTVADLITWLKAIDEGYAHAFENPELIRAAVNQGFVNHDHPLEKADEVAFFPPVTGG